MLIMFIINRLWVLKNWSSLFQNKLCKQCFFGSEEDISWNFVGWFVLKVQTNLVVGIIQPVKLSSAPHATVLQCWCHAAVMQTLTTNNRRDRNLVRTLQIFTYLSCNMQPTLCVLLVVWALIPAQCQDITKYVKLGWDLAIARYQPRPCGQQGGF